MKLFISCRRMLLLMLLCFPAMLSKAQTSPVASASGYSIWESISLSSPLSGQPFTYNVFFTLPSGASNFFITAYLPSELVIDAITAPTGPASYAGNAYNLAQIPGSNAVRLTFPAPISGNISGSFQVHAHFPYAGACNRTVGTYVELKSETVNLVTQRIFTNCVVDKTWHLQKYSLGTTYVGGNNCNYQTVDSTIEYGIKIVRSSSQIWGSYSLNVGALTDVPPSGGVITGLTYVSPSLAGTTYSGGFNIGPALFDPASAYELRFKVKYNVSGCLKNVATLTGTNGCGTSVSFTDTSKVEIVEQLPVNSKLVKSVYTYGNLPGCKGIYTIRVYNYGSVPIGYNLRDTFPACLDSSVAINTFPSGGSSVTLTSGAVPAIATMHGVGLAGFGASHTYTFTFTIGSNCAPTFTNVVRADSGFIASSQATVALLPAGAKPCIKKTICGPNFLFNVGDTVRFRLRVQNIGGTPITGGIITDSLDINNLSYIGNEMHYYANTAANLGCKPVLTPITGSGPYAWGSFGSTYNAGTGVIKWSVPEIPVQCSNVPNPVCESAGNAPAYYIEFDVKIKDTAGIGNVFNRVIIDGGNIVAPATGFVSIITKGYINYSAAKQVSIDKVTYAPAATAPAGSLVYYKLIATNYGIAIRNATLVDLLPRDNSGTDNFILWNGNRSPGGGFDIRYNGPEPSSHTSTADSSSFNSGIITTNELGVTVNSSAAGWTPGLTPGSADIKTRLTQQIGSSLPLNYIFSAKVDAAAKENDVMCNTYALRGFAKYLQNAAVNYMLLGALESSTACVTATKSDPCCNPYKFEIPKEVCFGTSAQFCVKDTCKEGSILYYWDFGDGTPGQYGTCVTHAYANPGTYYVVVKWRNECGEYSTDKYDVNVKMCPCKIAVNFTLFTTGLDMVADGSASVSAQPIAAYVWDYGDGTFGTGAVSTHTYANSGSYTVTLIVYSMGPNGEICECREKCSSKIEVDPRLEKRWSCGERSQDPGDVKDLKKAADEITMTAPPNPFSDRVNVNFQVPASKVQKAQAYTLSLMSAGGSVLQTRALKTLHTTASFDTAKYSTGVYYLMLRGADEQVKSVKVIKIN